MVLKFYTSVERRLKLKVKKFLGLIPTFVEVTEKNLVRGAFLTPHILSRVKYGFRSDCTEKFQINTSEV